MDCIKITDLEMYCHHGVFKEENVLGQKFLVTAVLYTNIREAGKRDDISASINYADVAHYIKEFMKKNTFQLIEAVAEQLSERILLHFDKVEKIKLTVKKPWAPVLLPLDTVLVEIERGWHNVYLSVGSNMGNRRENLLDAMARMEEKEKIKVIQKSKLIETKPYGKTDQADFLNGAVHIKTLYTPEELLQCIHEVEYAGGRERKEKWGPRTIDMDILLYDDRVLQTEELTIPHIEMHKRGFVLVPMAEIAPWVKHPVYNKTIEQMKEELTNDGFNGSKEEN